MGLKKTKTIAVVLYPGVTALDVVGTMQAMIWLHAKSPYRLVTVAERSESIPTDTPLKLVPGKTFAEVDAPFGLLVPGGDAAHAASRNEALRRYVQAAGKSAELVASVGTGTLILAEAGLLGGRQATTHWQYAARLEALDVRYVRQRWVEDGKFVTAAGVTAGIDLGLFLVGKLTSIAKARNAQLIIEYAPQPPFGGIDWNRVEWDATDKRLAAN
jgi:transcriptional regulator GlxA family with amidase domain